MRPAQLFSRPVVAGVCLLALTLIGGCRDEASDPTALIVTEEVRGAFSLETSIPSVTTLAERIGSGETSISEERLREWSGAWQASWLAPPAEALPARRGLYERAAGPLADALGEEGVRRTVREVGDAVEATFEVDLGGAAEAYRRQVESARELAARADRSLEAGRPAAALRAALMAGDYLRSVSPRRVAEGLLARAEEAQREIPEASPLSREERERIARLVRNARQALEAGEYTLAIRRAYYADRLMTVEIH